MTPDVNVLVAASRADHPHHRAAHDWLAALLKEPPGGPLLCLLPTVVASFLRLVTHPRVFADAMPMPSAVGFIDAIKAAPACYAPAPQDEWPHFRQLCLTRRLTGNRVPDAWIAAQVLQGGEVLVTFDRDFQKLLPAHQVLLLSPSV